MIALSVRQPWAWALVHRFKPIENRRWVTNYRGPMLIHAAKRFDIDGWDFISETFPEIPLPPIEEFVAGVHGLGGIVGGGNLVDCVRAHQSRWFFGPYGFVLGEAYPAQFLACRGQLGFFPIDKALEAKIVRQQPLGAAAPC